MHPIHCQHGAILGRIGEQYFQQILIVPQPAFGAEPFFGVNPRREHIVDMLQHPGGQPRDNLLKLDEHIAKGADHVAAIDEQSAARLQFVEQLERDIFDALADDLWIKLFEPRHFVRFDADMAAVIGWIISAVPGDGLTREAKRVARADL